MIASNQYDYSVKPTKELYDGIQKAYEYFNSRLFKGELPNCVITLQRSKNSYGYFCGNRFQREDGIQSDEIALNPAHFNDRPPTEVLATLVHEMVHLWQHHFGTPGRARYHNREWAEKMKALGLQPTSTGIEGGKETGDRMSHLVVSGGRFEKAANKNLSNGFGLSWTERILELSHIDKSPTLEDEEKSKSGKRVKYSCPECGLNAWASHSAEIDCHQHKVLMLPA